MDTTEERLGRIFFAYSLDKIKGVREQGTRFVYYTTADVAMSIIRNREIWMRNTTTMNDFREMEHGWECFVHTWKGHVGDRLKAVLDTISPGLADTAGAHLDGWSNHYRYNTFITCVSVHSSTEDTNGRLSMWRAYGRSNGVALVVRNTPFVAETNVLAAYTSPVLYATKDQFAERFGDIVAAMERDLVFLREEGSSTVLNNLVAAIRFAVLSTKHPGFAEEQEWRIIHSPSVEPSSHLLSSLELVNGVAQRVYKIKIRDYSQEGLPGMQLGELLDRVILGPTAFPPVMFDAFVQALQDAGVANADRLVAVSGIPLRTS